MVTFLLFAACALPPAPGEGECVRYLDDDGDGYGDPAWVRDVCDGRSGWVESGGDCDDSDPDIHPWAHEWCDGVDGDCDGEVSPAVTWYRDADRDGYGDPDVTEVTCDEPRGYVDNAEDCDDFDRDAHPGGIWYWDGDGDGYGTDGETTEACLAPSSRWVADDRDCDDDDGSTNPGEREACDLVDNDCDGVVDESGASGEQLFYIDADRDGWGGSGDDLSCWQGPAHAVVGGDCDDADATTFPGAPEPDCDDPVDHNCDGSAGHVDADGDTYEACADCDDRTLTRRPGAWETCDDQDDDCDGVIDEDPIDALAWYLDGDSDGWGVESEVILSCDGGPRLAAVAGDCDDGDAAVGAGEPEDCATEADDDCDGDVNDDGATGCVAWYPDADRDGWGADEVCTCTITSATATADGDCDDAHAAANPDGVEACGNGIDEDCLASPECGFAGELSLADAAAVVVGEDADDGLGYAAAVADDLDGDGAAELLVGARGLDGALGGEGGALVFASPFSGTLRESDAIAILLGEASGAETGRWVAGLGDLDGDGLGDVAVASTSISTGTGAVYVVAGADLYGEVTLADQGVRDGLAVRDYFGWVAGPGDVDGDGLADLLVGATGAGAAGAAYLFAGPVQGRADATDAIATLEGAAASDSAGGAPGGADFDGDGLADLVVTATGSDDPVGVGGAAYVLYGPVVGTVSLWTADATIVAVTSNTQLGGAVATGDTDGDGLADLAVSAPQVDVGYVRDCGAVYLFQGPPRGPATTAGAVASWVGQAYEEAGDTLALTDLDGDGLADLVSSAVHSRGSLYGVRIFTAPLTGALAAESSVVGAPGDHLGQGLAGAGDTDGDGYGDLWLGAYQRDDTGGGEGAAYLFLGGPGS